MVGAPKTARFQNRPTVTRFDAVRRRYMNLKYRPHVQHCFQTCVKAIYKSLFEACMLKCCAIRTCVLGFFRICVPTNLSENVSNLAYHKEIYMDLNTMSFLQAKETTLSKISYF
mgnify:FL=1